MTETLSMEAIADAGEIGISPAMVSLLPPAVIGPPKGGITLLGGPPDIERRRAPDVGDVRGLDIASCIPVAARAHVLLRKSEPEHRTITAAFIDMMDTGGAPRHRSGAMSHKWSESTPSTGSVAPSGPASHQPHLDRSSGSRERDTTTVGEPPAPFLEGRAVLERVHGPPAMKKPGPHVGAPACGNLGSGITG